MVVSILPHAELGLNNHRKDVPHFSYQPNTFSGMSQEAGKIKSRDDSVDFTKSFKVDDLIRILPAHSCHTAAFHPHYHLMEKNENGEQVITDTISPCRGW